jgi:hypothetical protein
MVFDLPNLTIMYSCFGSGSAQTVFDSNDWNSIGDDISLPASFFLPLPGPCDLTGATNGPNAGAATSVWQCDGLHQTDPLSFTLQFFDDGNVVTSAGGSFQITPFTPSSGGCGFSGVSVGGVSDGAVSLSYAADRDVLNYLAVAPDVNRFFLSECHRQLLQ